MTIEVIASGIALVCLWVLERQRCRYRQTLRNIVDRYEARGELYVDDADCAESLAAHAANALEG